MTLACKIVATVSPLLSNFSNDSGHLGAFAKADTAPARLTQLGGCWYRLSVLFDMRLCRFPGVVHRVFVMTAGEVRVMRCRLVFSSFMVLCGFLVVSCRVFVMFCCLVMMVCCFS
jgi:hypothetical protein